MYLANRGASVRKYEQIEYEKKEKIKSEEKNKIEIDLKDIAFKNENYKKFENEYLIQTKKRISIWAEIYFEILNKNKKFNTDQVKIINCEYLIEIENLLKRKNNEVIFEISLESVENLKFDNNNIIDFIIKLKDEIKELEFEIDAPSKVINSNINYLGNILYFPQKNHPVYTIESEKIVFEMFRLTNDQIKNAIYEIDVEYSKLEYAYNKSLNNYIEKSEQFYSNELKEYNREFGRWKKRKNDCIEYLETNIKKINFSESIEETVLLLLESTFYPIWMPSNFNIKVDKESKILIVDQEFPNLYEISLTKSIDGIGGKKVKKLNQKEMNELIKIFYPLLTLKLAVNIANLSQSSSIDLIVINGWVDYRNKANGKMARAYVSSLAAKTLDLKDIELPYVDIIVAFSSLKGNFSRTLEITPIAPILRINNNDPRFIDNQDVLDNLNIDQNLAAMNWEDFEHLCREIFERIYEKDGATVKVTQASRDQGVDAIIIDPRPIHGGKTVIQAKRYVNVVDVAAVRDLYGTVQHEGANKGILVTTSYFGPDSYNFIKGKNIELINGSELLYILQEYGYKFKIDLEDARKSLKDSGQIPFQRKK